MLKIERVKLLLTKVRDKKSISNSNFANSAFALVELAILLVVIGLLIGGVLAGQDLIRAAETRAVIGDVDKYKASIYSFKDKNNCLPGDCSQATQFITGAINGDGNGRIGDFITRSTVGDIEAWQVWYQLAQTGLISGNYTGTHGSVGTQHSQIGINEPVSKLGNSVGYFIIDWNHYSDVYDWGGVANGPLCVMCKFNHVITLGSTWSGWGESVATGFSPSIAYAIDSKIDDGMPALGNVAFVYQSPIVSGCVSDHNAPSTATYTLTNNTNSCMLFFKLGF